MRALDERSMVLRIQGVSKVYGSGSAAVKAVDDINFLVSEGQVVAIMGPSGSGKTTLLSIAGALLRPTSGSVLMADRELTKLSEPDLAYVRLEKIGFIFQSFNLLSALTALENVQVVMDFAGVSRRKAQDRARELLTDLGLEKRLKHYPNELSGGEKQRVAIARALANDPDLILADEPTANLDSKTGHFVVELLRKIANERRKSVVIVSHDVRIIDIADRVLQLEDGRLREGAVDSTTDPVCGMRLPQSKAAMRADYQGETYYFCSRRCHDEFMERPKKFADRENEGGDIS
jgi:putative ABC transport system ATP-binding protein